MISARSDVRRHLVADLRRGDRAAAQRHVRERAHPRLDRVGRAALVLLVGREQVGGAPVAGDEPLVAARLVGHHRRHAADAACARATCADRAPAPAALSAAASSRTSATSCGAAYVPVAATTASRATTASADGSSKSLSLPSSPNTGSANTAATSTMISEPSRIGLRRRKITASGASSRTRASPPR